MKIDRRGSVWRTKALRKVATCANLYCRKTFSMINEHLTKTKESYSSSSKIIHSTSSGYTYQKPPSRHENGGSHIAMLKFGEVIEWNHTHMIAQFN
jgi:hypothetical protein